MSAQDKDVLPSLELGSIFEITDAGDAADIDCDNGNFYFTASLDVERAKRLRDWLSAWIVKKGASE